MTLPKIGSEWRGTANHQPYIIKVTKIERRKSGPIISYRFLPILDHKAAHNKMTHRRWEILAEEEHMAEHKDGLDLAVERLTA